MIKVGAEGVKRKGVFSTIPGVSGLYGPGMLAGNQDLSFSPIYPPL